MAYVKIGSKFVNNLEFETALSLQIGLKTEQNAAHRESNWADINDLTGINTENLQNETI